MDDQSLINKEISFIEKCFSEDLVLQSEILLEKSAINAKLKSTNLWDITVADQSFHFQLTLTLKNDIIKEYQCNCNQFLSGKLCSHVCSALLFVRSKKDIIIQQKKATKRTTNRLTKIRDIVKQMPKEEISQLILDYAKRDDLFKLVIYARQYDMLSSEEKVNVVERSFPIHTQIAQKVTPRSLNNFLAVCEELKAQFSKLIGTENFREAFHLILLLLKKSFYIKSKMTSEHKSFLDNHKRLLENYYEILEIIEAPEFKFLALDSTLELLSSSYISMESEEEQHLWINLYNKPSHHKQLSVITNKYLSIGKSEDLSSYYFIYTLQLLLDRQDKEGTVLEIDSQQSYRIIQVLLKLQHVNGVKQLLKDLVIHKKANNFLALQILAALPNEFYDDDLRNTVIDLYVKSGNSEFLDFIVFEDGNVEASTKYLESRLHEHSNPGHLINYLIQEDRKEEALEHLDKNLDLKVLMKFDNQLYSDHGEAVLQLYKNVCDQYMESHFGPQSRDYLINIYQHLQRIGATKIKNKLIDHIQSEFAKRKSLTKI